jgi:hypothetical protein
MHKTTHYTCFPPYHASLTAFYTDNSARFPGEEPKCSELFRALNSQALIIKNSSGDFKEDRT